MECAFCFSAFFGWCCCSFYEWNAIELNTPIFENNKLMLSQVVVFPPIPLFVLPFPLFTFSSLKNVKVKVK